MFLGNDFTRCSQCSTVVKTTDAVLDAVRIGQEALDKATALQFEGLSQNFAKCALSLILPIEFRSD